MFLKVCTRLKSSHFCAQEHFINFFCEPLFCVFFNTQSHDCAAEKCSSSCFLTFFSLTFCCHKFKMSFTFDVFLSVMDEIQVYFGFYLRVSLLARQLWRAHFQIFAMAVQIHGGRRTCEAIKKAPDDGSEEVKNR